MTVIPVPNQDSNWTDFSGLYAKGLKQDHKGIPNKASYQTFINEIDRGIMAGTNLPITPPLFENPAMIVGPAGKQNGPQGAFTKQLVGPQSPMYSTEKSPEVGSAEYALELAELYWASLLRDVPFTEYHNNQIAQDAAAHLTMHVANYRGPVDGGGKVTPELLFRGGLPAHKRSANAPAYFADELAGPYLSQLCILPTSLGAQAIDQKMQIFSAGVDFMTDIDEWFKVQNGISTGRSLTPDPTRRYMRNGRALASFTHQDELYQAYLVAYLVLKTMKAPSNPGIPYSPAFSGTRYKNQQPFGNFGGPDIVGTLGLVAKTAIDAVWYQKWAVHLRARPEAGGGLVHLWKTAAVPAPGAVAAFGPTAAGTFADILQKPLMESAAHFSPASGPKTFLLSQAFPEGSPPHPAYPTGHGAVAGACITALKVFFDGSQHISALTPPMQPAAADGLTLNPYTGADANAMTINGELHKLAHNISFGHGILAGIHWRSDTDESILFGEQVAIKVLEEQIATYPEPVKIDITLMDGSLKTFAN